MQEITTTANGDTIGVAAESAITTRWDSAPFRSETAERKARWRFAELIYESAANEAISISTWLDLDLSTISTVSITLSPTVIVPTPNSMIWSTVAGSTDPRMYWGNVTNTIKWAGGTDGTFAGDVRIPVVGRSELFSMRVANSNISSFKITANEIYKTEGGLRQ